MTDVWLKLTGTKVQAMVALRTLGLDRVMLQPQKQGPPKIGSVYNHDVALNFVPDRPVKFATHDNLGIELTPAVFDGPHLMVRFVSERLNDIAAQKIVEHRKDLPDLPRSLPQGLEVVPDPGTIEWAGDPAP